jgi:hypothetical protein
MQNQTQPKKQSLDLNRIIAMLLFLIVIIFIYFLYLNNKKLNYLNLAEIYGVTSKGKIVDTVVIQKHNQPPCKIESVLSNGVKTIQNNCDITKQPSNINSIILAILFISLAVIFIILNYFKII